MSGRIRYWTYALLFGACSALSFRAAIIVEDLKSQWLLALLGLIAASFFSVIVKNEAT